MIKSFKIFIIGIATLGISGSLYFYFSPSPETNTGAPVSTSGQEKIRNVERKLENAIPSLKQEVVRKVAKSRIPDLQSPLRAAKVVAAPKPLVPDVVAKFFDQFDFNNDGVLSIGEGEDFYYWVEDNIQYRYDDEQETNAPPGSLIGDDRDGPDYRQTPLETLEEGAGDCEDTATLEVAFYTYWGIQVFVAGVNADDPQYIDHAVAIVQIDDSLQDFVNLLGDLMYWEFKSGEEIRAWKIETIPAGFYMLVDNAYSDDFGYLTDGIKEDRFNILDLVSLESPYGNEWNEFHEASSYEWTE